MRPGQEFVFLEIPLGVIFIITMFCLCRYFDIRKSKRRKNKAKAADEDCYQRQLSAQRERALSIRRESLFHEASGNADAKEPLTKAEPTPEEAEAAEKASEKPAAEAAAAAEGEAGKKE